MDKAAQVPKTVLEFVLVAVWVSVLTKETAAVIVIRPRTSIFGAIMIIVPFVTRLQIVVGPIVPAHVHPGPSVPEIVPSVWTISVRRPVDALPLVRMTVSVLQTLMVVLCVLQTLVPSLMVAVPFVSPILTVSKIRMDAQNVSETNASKEAVVLCVIISLTVLAKEIAPNAWDGFQGVGVSVPLVVVSPALAVSNAMGP